MTDLLLDQLTQTELQDLITLAKGSVYKAQELADAAEADALRLCGPQFQASGARPRKWEHQTTYVSLDGAFTAFTPSGRWVRRAAGIATLAAVDAVGGVWLQDVASGVWVSAGSGRTATIAPGETLRLPAGDCYIDPDRKAVFLPAVAWVDQATGEVAAIDPVNPGQVPADQWVGGELPVGNTHPVGLSDLIPAPQEYAMVRLLLAGGGLTPAETAAWTAAVADFETVGPWEDRRQPIYQLTSTGQLQLDAEGRPVPNRLRFVSVPYRGELNEYYRMLARDHGIDPFTARTAEQFELIKLGPATATLGDAVRRRYATAHAECVRVFKAAFYDPAFQNDPLYFGYCRLFIAWMAVMRTLDSKMVGIGDVDRMGHYDVTNMLYSFGIYGFDDMPLVYRRRLAKNLERIIADKGTARAFRSILEVFNLGDEVTVWEHYLVRYFPSLSSHYRVSRAPDAGENWRLVLSGGGTLTDTTLNGLVAQLRDVAGVRQAGADADGLGAWFFPTRDSEAFIEALDLINAGGAVTVTGQAASQSQDYALPEVGFLKVPMGEALSENYLTSADLARIEDYDEATGGDPTWKTTREEARGMAFSTLRSKYFSLTAALDTLRNGMAVSMLWSTLKDAQVRGRAGHLSARGGPADMNAMEAIVAMLMLLLWKLEVSDIIPHGESGVSTILGARVDGAAFPGEGSLLPFSSTLARVTDRPEPLGSADVRDIVESNLKVSERIEGELVHSAKTAGEYHPLLGGEESTAVGRVQAIERMWKHKFVARYQTAAFGSHETYSSWLAYSNQALYDWVIAQDTAGKHDEAILALATILEDAIQAKTFSLSSAVGATDVLLQYVERLIRFFKAYTTDLKDFATFMLVDDPAFETVRLMNLLAGVQGSWLRADGRVLNDMLAAVSVWARTNYLHLEDVGRVLSRHLPEDAIEAVDWRRLLSELELDHAAVALSEQVAMSGLSQILQSDVEPVDALAAFASLMRLEQAIVSVADASWLKGHSLAVSPSSGLRDTVSLHAGKRHEDRTTVRTRGLTPAVGRGAGLDDNVTIH